MEDIVEEPVMDIDSCDAKNPLAVVDYIEDLHAYYRKMEVYRIMKQFHLETHWSFRCSQCNFRTSRDTSKKKNYMFSYAWQLLGSSFELLVQFILIEFPCRTYPINISAEFYDML